MFRWAAFLTLIPAAILLPLTSSYPATPETIVETGPTRVAVFEMVTGTVITASDSLANWNAVLQVVIDATASTTDVTLRVYPKAGGMTTIPVEAGKALTLPLQFEALNRIAANGDTTIASTSGSFRLYVLGD